MLIRTRLISAFLIGMWLGTSAHAGAMKSLEDAQETSSDQVVFPSSDVGTFYFKNCPSCNQNPIRMTPTSKLFIGGQQISLIEFKKELAAKDQRFLTIFYAPADRLVTRVVMMPPTTRQVPAR